MQASLTGHLVLSTLHTNDRAQRGLAPARPGRAAHLIQSTLTGVVAQRPVRTLCPHCKMPAAVDEPARRALTHGWNVELPPAMGPQGCLECRNTGYLGRTGIYEMMRLTPRLRGLIEADTNVVRYAEAALAEGLRPLRLSAAAQVARGITTIAEVMTVLPPLE